MQQPEEVVNDKAAGTTASREKEALRKTILYKKVFANPEGEEVISDLMQLTGHFSQSHVPGDPYSTAFNDGQKNVVNTILRAIQLNPERYIELVEEQLKQEEKSNEEYLGFE